MIKKKIKIENIELYAWHLILSLKQDDLLEHALDSLKKINEATYKLVESDLMKLQNDHNKRNRMSKAHHSAVKFLIDLLTDHGNTIVTVPHRRR